VCQPPASVTPRAEQYLDVSDPKELLAALGSVLNRTTVISNAFTCHPRGGLAGMLGAAAQETPRMKRPETARVLGAVALETPRTARRSRQVPLSSRLVSVGSGQLTTRTPSSAAVLPMVLRVVALLFFVRDIIDALFLKRKVSEKESVFRDFINTDHGGSTSAEVQDQARTMTINCTREIIRLRELYGFALSSNRASSGSRLVGLSAETIIIKDVAAVLQVAVAPFAETFPSRSDPELLATIRRSTVLINVVQASLLSTSEQSLQQECLLGTVCQLRRKVADFEQLLTK
jgi:hypothetical protein